MDPVSFFSLFLWSIPGAAAIVAGFHYTVRAQRHFERNRKAVFPILSDDLVARHETCDNCYLEEAASGWGYGLDRKAAIFKARRAQDRNQAKIGNDPKFKIPSGHTPTCRCSGEPHTVAAQCQMKLTSCGPADAAWWALNALKKEDHEAAVAKVEEYLAKALKDDYLPGYIEWSWTAEKGWHRDMGRGYAAPLTVKAKAPPKKKAKAAKAVTPPVEDRRPPPMPLPGTNPVSVPLSEHNLKLVWTADEVRVLKERALETAKAEFATYDKGGWPSEGRRLCGLCLGRRVREGPAYKPGDLCSRCDRHVKFPDPPSKLRTLFSTPRPICGLCEIPLDAREHGYGNELCEVCEPRVDDQVTEARKGGGHWTVKTLIGAWRKNQALSVRDSAERLCEGCKKVPVRDLLKVEKLYCSACTARTTTKCLRCALSLKHIELYNGNSVLCFDCRPWKEPAINYLHAKFWIERYGVKPDLWFLQDEKPPIESSKSTLGALLDHAESMFVEPAKVVTLISPRTNTAPKPVCVVCRDILKKPLQLILDPKGYPSGFCPQHAKCSCSTDDPFVTGEVCARCEYDVRSKPCDGCLNVPCVCDEYGPPPKNVPLSDLIGKSPPSEKPLLKSATSDKWYMDQATMRWKCLRCKKTMGFEECFLRSVPVCDTCDRDQSSKPPHERT